MVKEYKTVRDATEMWVHEMNAIPQGMIQDLMSLHPDDWMEVTKPSTGDRVYIYDLPDEVDSIEHGGEVKSYNGESELYCIELDDGKLVSAEADDFEVEYDGLLPMWGTMWSFGDSCDDWWLEEDDGMTRRPRKTTRCTLSKATPCASSAARKSGATRTALP